MANLRIINHTRASPQASVGPQRRRGFGVTDDLAPWWCPGKKFLADGLHAAATPQGLRFPNIRLCCIMQAPRKGTLKSSPQT